MRNPLDTRTAAAKLATAGHNLIKLAAALAVLAICLAIPVGIVVAIVHFIAKYW